MNEINFYTNVASSIQLNPNIYGLIFDNPYEKSESKPFNEILKNWDLILQSLKDNDVLYMMYPMILWKELSLKYENINFKLIDTHFINRHCCCPPYGTPTTVIKNPKSKKFIIISFCDYNKWISDGEIPKNHPTYVEGYSSWDLINCVDFFPIQGVHDHPLTYKTNTETTWMPSNKEGLKYRPGLPIPSYYYTIHEHIEKIYSNKNRVIPEKLFIDCRVGGSHFRDQYLPNDDRFEITFRQNLSPIIFIEKFAKYSIIMDVNAIAEVSSRTFEGLGLGCAVIRPELNIQYHNKLIPNYHYASVDCDDLSDFKKLSDAYVNKFNELKENPQLIEFYGKNGRKWYEENCKLESWIKIFINELIDLEKLNFTF